MLGIVLLTVAMRLPVILHPLPIDDEAGYSVIVNEIVDGGRPYIDAVRCFCALGIYVADDDFGTLTCEEDARRTSDTSAAASNNCYFVTEIELSGIEG